MLIKLNVVRHGESYTNINKLLSCNNNDLGLTKKGINESSIAAKWLSKKQISVIYTSPLRRAMETAEIINRQFGVKIRALEELREINVGSLENSSTRQDWEYHNFIIDSWKRGNWFLRFPNGESFYDLINRVHEAILHISDLKKHSAIITHGGVLLAIRYGLCNSEITVDTQTGSITQLIIHKENNTINYNRLYDPI